ncbi:hypothetical protein SADUNF_Sadunf10G0125600 [Salix dunnii]|uniref:SET domain-containing protein n=1 Tax=Salix dunnii TaxID=1413687 RepID=A0A835MPS2_9ROSI|nr:hypothetical protein SADUNF_Sadunf10G0125600 [Salix dunnii]
MTSNRIGFAIASLCSAKHFKLAEVLGKNSDCYGAGFWVLASFVNHSCNSNARRFHHAKGNVRNGFFSICKRCKHEEEMCFKQEMKEIEIRVDRGMDVGGVIFRLEEGGRWMARRKERGYLEASFWAAYFEVYGSKKSLKRWGSRIPVSDSSG